MNDQDRPILLVEDNPMDVDLTRRAFKKQKVLHPVVIARDGEEAVAVLNSWPKNKPTPILILLDLKLPKVDGLEVLQHIKADPRFRPVPVVILTTSAEDRDIQAAYLGGANSYIAKPVDFDQFMRVVDQIQIYWCGMNIPPRSSS